MVACFQRKAESRLGFEEIVDYGRGGLPGRVAHIHLDGLVGPRKIEHRAVGRTAGDLFDRSGVELQLQRVLPGPFADLLSLDAIGFVVDQNALGAVVKP